VLAAAVGLDMGVAGWAATADSYLGRVTTRILEAVREAKGDKAAGRISGLKKPDLVVAAEELLAGTGWLPEVLRTPTLMRAALMEWSGQRIWRTT
jgi:ParB family transcriptional regulator, chromosome partitioning protein